MSGTETIGLLVFGVGILILLFAFYEAYLLYEQMISASAMTSTPTTVNTAAANTTQGIVQGIVQGIAGYFPFRQATYYLLAIIILFVFASIGYKIAKLGIDLRSSWRRKDDASQQQKQQKQQKVA
ncbi:MAG: hypothetical protein QW298_01605 [Candidatus Micrarchaeaceae archaeon]